MVTFIPPSAASRELDALLSGMGPGVYFDFATFNFQVPIVLSAASAPIVVRARATRVLVNMARILASFESLWPRLFEFPSVPNNAPLRVAAGGKLENRLIVSNSIPADQRQGRDDITSGNCWEGVGESQSKVLRLSVCRAK